MGKFLILKGTQQRFLEAMTDYCNGVLEHVNQGSQKQTPTIEEMLATRRRSIGVTPLYAFVEYAASLYQLTFAYH